MPRRYYSERSGRGPGAVALDLDDLKRLFKSMFASLEYEGYFQEDLGYDCVDSGFVPGLIGTDLQAELLLTLRKPQLWPIHTTIETWAEDDVFDMIEFLYDHISKPTERHFHSFSGCGWHCTKFDRKEGQHEFREKVNRLLKSYDAGFELSAKGEVLALPPSGLEPILAAAIPHPDQEGVVARVNAAVTKFRRHRSSVQDRRDAVRDLADVLELLRPMLKKVLTSKDEADLFNIANNFGVRHHNVSQKTHYDLSIWLSWMFYYYLATIHAAVRLIKKSKGSAP